MRWRLHPEFLVLLAIAAPITIAFSWQHVIASLGDDSVSYLTLARYLSPFSSDALAAPWAKHHANFPPFFPLLLAFTGGAYSLLAAHLAVGVCALAALCLVYLYAERHLGGPRRGALVALLVLLTPSAWVSVRGILSEPLFLALSLAALVFHERRLATDRGKAALLAFGALMAAAYLTRIAGIALIAGYAIHVAVEAVRRNRRPVWTAFLPFAPVLVLASVWMALRPAVEMDGYRHAAQGMLGHWLSEPGRLLAISSDTFFGGWVASFTGSSAVGGVTRVMFGAVGALGIAGAIRGAMRNRLDAWYVLASLAMLFAWVFPEDNTRRLLYPLLPLLLVLAGEALAALCTRVRALRREGLVLFVGWAFLVVMILPATVLVLRKSLDTAPLIPGFAYSPASMTEYYTTVDRARANALAYQHAAVLSGLESLDRATPPGARVMWMRPEYIALLGKREGVPWYFRWDRPTLAREIGESGTTHLVVTRLFKADLALQGGDAFAALAIDPPPYLRAIQVIASPTGSQEFVLLEVDRSALGR